MALLRIPTFDARQEVVDSQRRFTPATLRSFNEAFRQVFTTVNQIAQLLGLTSQLQLAIAAANQAAAAAQAAADAANGVANDTRREAALVNSYIEPSRVLTATDTTITVASHTRFYADGTSVAVNGETIPTTGPGDVDYVFYDDPVRAGGTVTYLVDTTQPIQTGNRHVVGAVTVPGAGQPPNDGGNGPRPPGEVQP